VIRWNVISTALIKLFSRLAVSAAQAEEAADLAQWAEKKRRYTDTTQMADLLLRVVAVSSIGEDERRYEENNPEAPDDQLLERIVGNRRLSLEVRVDHLDHDEEAGAWAIGMLERIRARLKFQSSIAELQAANLAVSSTGTTVDASLDWDGHRMNSATMEVVLNAVVDILDDVPTGTIARVRLTSTLTNPADQAVSPSVNVTALLIDTDPTP
jgi:hypothetical protein